ncbi:PASTA domain-containing protein [Streptomyces sp. NPDC096046]|uniref:PASTA domain-containing protein n=1 Tax=Streptomyces sp. NPDC096046 TaxID=3155542 RepID=UPI0033175C4A
MSRKEPDVRVPRLVGLMAVDARETARAQGLLLGAPDRPGFHLAVVDHVVRQYPRAGAEVPRESMAYVWFDFGSGEGGGGVREPRLPRPPRGGLQREPDESGDDPYPVLSPAGAISPA